MANRIRGHFGEHRTTGLRKVGESGVLRRLTNPFTHALVSLSASLAGKIYSRRRFVLYAQVGECSVRVATPEGCRLVVVRSVEDARRLTVAPERLASLNLDRLGDRLSGKNRVACVVMNGVLVHTTWVSSHPTEATHDPVLRQLPHLEAATYVGPSATLNSARGLGIYPWVLSEVVAEARQRALAPVFINTSAANAPSQSGILKAGFSPKEVVTCVSVLGRERWSFEATPLSGAPLLWFRPSLMNSGGGERLTLEVLKALHEEGRDVSLVSFAADLDAVFDGRYAIPLVQRGDGNWPAGDSPIGHLLFRRRRVRWLKDRLREARPGVVVTSGTWAGQATILSHAARGLGVPYAVHVFGSVFASDLERTKYTLAFRRAFKEVRESLASYMEVTPLRLPSMSLISRLRLEWIGLQKLRALQTATTLFVLSRRNRWEVQRLYRRPAQVLKGAFPRSIFEHEPNRVVLEGYGLMGRRFMLSVCRLVDHKRVDLALRAFAERTHHDLTFVIGGSGPERESLESLAEELGCAERVRFLGYVPDEHLWDLMACAELFVSLDLADFDIAPLEALALGTPVVWSTEVEMEPELSSCPWLVPALPEAQAVRLAMETALTAPDPTRQERVALLSRFSWESYASSMVAKIDNDLAARGVKRR